VSDEADRSRHADLGMNAVITRGQPRGIEFATELLRFTGVAEDRIAEWMRSVHATREDITSRAA